ncbi:MBL fold metallo-hydrolase [Syntrophotalea acetylenica]|uniref:MBL fold metallo-hydrolase n=1 Tax=Syntrophotalea acetylenica TaxID=29542 RepID=UPI002A35E350|nr:MBL fold metallo-hydrolase [Syntrophotalea acetylenica]MDY0262551.1 MBL fold metallo-hydrolase [Syntrophotalea acetylenica]
MQITEHIHALKIPFKVPVSQKVSLDRFAYVYLVFGDKIHLIDSGVAGAAKAILAYIKEHGKEPEDIASLILTHSHPDHIGAAKSIKKLTGCTVFAHKIEQDWIEDTEQQFKDRPVPGFQSLVEGSVEIDRFISDGEILELGNSLFCTIAHTPGHSRGSVSLLIEEEKSLFSGDALIFPGDLPIYENIANSIASIRALQKIDNLEYLFSSWESPMQGQENIRKRMDESILYLNRIHAAVLNNSNNSPQQNIMELCQKVVSELGLPSLAVMPLVAKAFASSLAVESI